MAHRWLLIALSFLAASPLVAQETGRTPGLSVTRLQDPDGANILLRLGLKPLPPIFAVDLPAVELGRYWLRPRYTDWTATWLRAARRGLKARQDTLWRAVRPGIADARKALPTAGAAADTAAMSEADVGPVPGDSLQETTADALVLPDVLGEHADLWMRITGRGELGGAWTRYQPCDPGFQFNCNPSVFPHVKPDVQFGVQVGGTISERIHVSVDYDQRREFDAANNINVYYQGLEDEILQRLEVGDVSIQLPPSRYLTQGIPAGNFGFKATGQLGPLDFQAVWAQQNGDVSTREFRLSGAGGGGLIQDATVVLDDADYTHGQFFYLVHPDSLVGAPYIDPLALRAHDAPPSLRPALGASIQLYRDERPSALNPEQQGRLGYFLAQAVTADSVLRHSGSFRRLVPGEDYVVHPSGLWIVLRSPLRPDEALATAYVTERGDTVGAVDAELAGQETTPMLRLLRGPVTAHSPDQPTWDYELHQVYRLDSSSDVDPTAIQLDISLGELAGGATFARFAGRQIPFLKLFGLDEDAPAEQLDAAHVYQPARGGGDGLLPSGGTLGESAPIGGTFVILPALRPFAQPPPVPSAGLSGEEALAALGSDANPVIYENPDPVVRASNARFRLSFSYRVRTEGRVSSFDLGAFGIREGSETIVVGARELERDVDYTIDYDLGVVTLNDPDALFAANPGAELRATWEQKPLFQVAPTSVFGLNTRYALGTRGELNFTGLYQSERSIIARPQLGIEPSAIFLGGASGRFELGAGWLDRALDWVPGLHASGTSALNLSGELALSAPDPNRQGATYLDDFEATDQVPLQLDARSWRLGSRPGQAVGALDVLPAPLDVGSAVDLVWQHDYEAGDRIRGPLLPQAIDQEIQVAGARVAEPVLYLTFGRAQQPGRQRWRSLTTVLSTTGRDMTRSEFLEFYVASPPGQEFALVFDVGTVSEDAFYFNAEGNTTGVYPDGRRWGVGVLDEEASLAAREIWGADSDARGLWDQPCRADPGTPYPLGDPLANCTRGNGLVDTEDLDGNGAPDFEDGAYFRYVLRLDGSSPYLVRDTLETGTRFRLYRIPLQGAAGMAVNGASDVTWRFIRHLRLTVAAAPGPEAELALARMHIIGSRWTKRELHGVMRGLEGERPGRGAATTRFRVGPVSQITDGGAYTPPPGVRDELQDPTTAFGSSGVEFNEKGLRLAYDALQPGDRAEVYFRYPQQPRSLLSYRELRLWTLPRDGGWGATDGERLLVKVGTDAHNFYLFQTRLRPTTGGAANPEDWLPEVVIDFREWFELKARAEQMLLEGAPGESVELWSPDSTYAVVLEDRARAPNLAAVRELSFAVYNASGAPATGEVWIDDIRLGGAVTDAGVAGQLNLDMQAGDFVDAHVSYAHRGALFRQLNEDASYQTTAELSVRGTAELSRFAPAGWGIEAPLSISHTRTGLEPSFLEHTDVRADRLTGLRDTGAERTRVGLLLRKRTPSANPWLSVLLDGAELRLGYQKEATHAVTSAASSEGFDGALSYTRRPAPRELDITPGFVETALSWLVPDAVEQSALFGRLTDARLRWSPAQITFSSTYFDEESSSTRYDVILELPSDTVVQSIQAPRQGLETQAQVTLRPFASLTADVAMASSRDLLAPAEVSADPLDREAINAVRSELAGLDIGWETFRTLSAQAAFHPDLASWLRPAITYSSQFQSFGSPSYVEHIIQAGDTAAVLQRTFVGERRLTRSVVLDLPALFGPNSPPGDAPAPPGTAPAASFLVRTLRALGRALQPIELSWNGGLSSHFERETTAPDLGYQFGLGDLSSFRLMQNDTAATAVELDGFHARSGLRLPLGTELEVGYEQSDALVLELRGGRRTQRERRWPDLRVSWPELALPAPLRDAIPRASITAGYQVRRRAYTYGDVAGLGWISEDTSVPVQVSLGFRGGVSASYTAALTTGTSSDPTGDVEREIVSHSAQLTARFIAPGPLRERLPNPIRASLRYGYETELECRVRRAAPGDAACAPFVDVINRRLDLTLDTTVSQLNVGLRINYYDNQSFVGTRTGSSQFQLGLFGQFNVSAGTFPGGAP